HDRSVARGDETRMKATVTGRSSGPPTFAASTDEGDTEMRRMLVVLAAALSAAGCASQSAGASHAATATTNPAPPRFVSQVDNPWFPLKPGTVYRYRGIKDGQPSNEVFTVARGTQVIDGVRCTSVHDLLYIRGR